MHIRICEAHTNLGKHGGWHCKQQHTHFLSDGAEKGSCAGTPSLARVKVNYAHDPPTLHACAKSFDLRTSQACFRTTVPLSG
jgi:hypothetical protein